MISITPKQLLIFILGLLFSINISGQDKTHLKSPRDIKSRITIASEPDYPPYCIVDKNGKAAGLSIDLFKESAKAVGLEVKIKIGVWNKIKKDLADGEIDALPLMGRTPERESLYDFTLPYLTLHGAIFVREGTTNINSIADLKNKTIVLMHGDNAEEYVRREKISDHIVTTNTFAEAFQRLASGEYDAVIMQRVTGIKLLESLGINSIVASNVQLPEYKQDFCFAVKEGNHALLSKLNEGLSIIIANRKYDEIRLKWFGPEVKEVVSMQDILEVIIYTLIPATLLMLVAFVFILRREVKRRTLSLSNEIEIRKHAELQKELYGKVLELYHHYSDKRKLIKEIIELIRTHSGCEAVGIRLKEGEDYPYYETNGFVEGHVKYENFLCSIDRHGELLRDSVGNPILECMCGNIISGRFDPNLSFFTPNGSFWTNCTTELLASTTEGDRQARTRNRCNGEGYESVAIIPIKGDEDNIGLLQLNDFRRNRFTLETIEFYQNLTQAIGITLLGKHAEETLSKKIEELDRYFNYSLDLLCIANTRGEFIKLNPEWEKLLGYSVSELVGRPFLDFVHPEDIERTKKTLSYLFDKNEVLNFENRYKCKDGSYRWIEWRSKALESNIYAVARDVTDRKLAQEEVKQSEELFRMIFNSSPYAISLTAIENGQYFDINSTFERMIGYPKELVIGTTSIELGVWLSSEDRESYIDHLLASGFVDRKEYKFKTNGGKIIDTEVTARILMVGGKRVVLNIIVDVTEQKIVQEAIAQSREMLAKLAERVPGVVYQYRLYPDGKSCFPFSSPGMFEIYGVTPEEVREDATPVFGRLHPEDYDMIVSTIMDSARTLEFYHSEFRVILPEQGVRWRMCNAKPERLEDGSTLWYGIISDITDRKLVEAELEKHRLHLEDLVQSRTEEIDTINKQLKESLDKEKELSSLKSRFISTASHEFRTPLTSVLTSAELIQRYYERWGQDKVNEHLNRIKNSVSNLTKLMDDVLIVNRAESGKTVLMRSNVDLRSICNSVIEEVEIHAKDHHAIVLNYGTDRNYFLIDQKQIELILHNLISNAIKYSPNGGEISINVNADEKNLEFRICDSGIGIPEEDLPRLFESFHRAKNTIDIQGTGLGLSIVKNAVDLHEGTTEIKSKEGEGTTFVVTIPLLT